MLSLNEIINEYLKNLNKIYNIDFIKNPNNKFSLKFSLLVENFLMQYFELKLKNATNILVVALGSFGRRELSPKSDIEILFININNEFYKEIVDELKQLSYKVGLNFKFYRYFENVDYLNTQFTVYCKFTQARLIYGNRHTYQQWYDSKNALISGNLVTLYDKFILKYNSRVEKYGKYAAKIEPHIKYSAGGLRDLHEAEWIYSILKNQDFVLQTEVMQTNTFIDTLLKSGEIPPEFSESVLASYNFLLTIRNLLHFINNKKIDRLEFKDQEAIYKILIHNSNDEYEFTSALDFMKQYFKAANQINLFYNLFLVYFKEKISRKLPDELIIVLDDDFYQKGDTIFTRNFNQFSLSDILRLFFYRAKYNLYLHDSLKFKIVNDLKKINASNHLISESSAFFRELMELDNISSTLFLMHELGIFNYLIPEFAELSGYFENTINHIYTFEVHSLFAISNLEEILHGESKQKYLLFSLTPSERAQLYLAILLHDIAKPIVKAGNEMLAAEIAYTILSRLGYDDKEINPITKLIRNKRLLDKFAFNDNINDINKLNELAEIINNQKFLAQLYLLTYANFSAQSNLIFTPWKKERLELLYNKLLDIIITNKKIEQQIHPEIANLSEEIKQYIPEVSDQNIQIFLSSIRDERYFSSFDSKEMARQIKFFVEEENTQFAINIFPHEKDFDIVIIGKYNKYIFPSICGLLFLQNLNINESIYIKTKKDNLIAKVNVEMPVNDKKFNLEKLKNVLLADLFNVINGIVDIENLISQHQSYLKKIEKKIFKRKSFMDIYLNENLQYNVLEIKAIDKKGFLFKISNAIVNCGLNIYYAKTAVVGNRVECLLFVLTDEGKKISSYNYSFIQESIIQAYNDI